MKCANARIAKATFAKTRFAKANLLKPNSQKLNVQVQFAKCSLLTPQYPFASKTFVQLLGSSLDSGFWFLISVRPDLLRSLLSFLFQACFWFLAENYYLSLFFLWF